MYLQVIPIPYAMFFPEFSPFEHRNRAIIDYSHKTLLKLLIRFSRNFDVRTCYIDGIIFSKFRYRYNFRFSIQVELTRLAIIEFANETVYETVL